MQDSTAAKTASTRMLTIMAQMQSSTTIMNSICLMAERSDTGVCGNIIVRIYTRIRQQPSALSVPKKCSKKTEMMTVKWKTSRTRLSCGELKLPGEMSEVCSARHLHRRTSL